MSGRRVVETADAFDWLPAQEPAPLVTMLPDAAELGMDVHVYLGWFARAVSACFAASEGFPAVFCQTDRRANGGWHSKMFAIQKLADRKLTWHKIALRREPGRVDIHRPGYTHLLAYGGKPLAATPDVLPPAKRTWSNGVAENAAELVAAWIARQPSRPRVVLNPFCGEGMFLRALEAEGVEARGCDLDPERARKAEQLPLAAAPD